MTLMMRDQEMMEKGREEGIKAGREEGIKAGREEGIKAGREAGLKEGEKRGEIIGVIRVYRDELHLSVSQIIDKIAERFSLDAESARKYVQSTLENEETGDNK